MRVKGASIQQFLLGMALLAAVCWNLAHAGELRGLQLATGPTGTRAELRMDSEAGYQLISLAGPDRLVVDFPGSRIQPGMQLPAAKRPGACGPQRPADARHGPDRLRPRGPGDGAQATLRARCRWPAAGARVAGGRRRRPAGACSGRAGALSIPHRFRPMRRRACLRPFPPSPRLARRRCPLP